MLDNIRKKVMPDSLRSERDGIQAQLEKLYLDREDARMAAARKAQLAVTGQDAVDAREARVAWAGVAAVDEAIEPLRKRRREIEELLKEDTPVKAALVNVPPMPPSLVELSDALNEARERRQSLVAQVRTADAANDPRAVKKLSAQIAETEARIVELRQKRSEAMQPYNDAVRSALQPVIRATAERLHQAATGLIDALATLSEASAMLPASGAPVAAGIGQIASINTYDLHNIRELAAFLLANIAPELPE